MSFTFIEPMKALPVEKLPEGDWLYEIKHDGYRALAFKQGKEVRFISRNNKPLNYPQLIDSLKLLPAEHAILDGEIVALDEKGRFFFSVAPSLQELRATRAAGLLRLRSSLLGRQRSAQKTALGQAQAACRRTQKDASKYPDLR